MSMGDGYRLCFFRNNFFSDIIFFKFHSTQRRTKRLNLCEKNRSKQSLIHMASLFSKETLLVRTVYTRA